MSKSEAKNGYGVFGKAYEYMFKKDESQPRWNLENE